MTCGTQAAVELTPGCYKPAVASRPKRGASVWQATCNRLQPARVAPTCLDLDSPIAFTSSKNSLLRCAPACAATSPRRQPSGVSSRGDPTVRGQTSYHFEGSARSERHRDRCGRRSTSRLYHRTVSKDSHVCGHGHDIVRDTGHGEERPPCTPHITRLALFSPSCTVTFNTVTIVI